MVGQLDITKAMGFKNPVLKNPVMSVSASQQRMRMDAFTLFLNWA
jgi:hypothetical protein